MRQMLWMWMPWMLMEKQEMDKNAIADTLKKLLSKHITQRNRTLTFEHYNGRETVFVARACTTPPNASSERQIIANR
jgi:hypothetical protein